LAGTSWRCRTNVLRSSVLALAYSVEKYSAPARERSVYTKKLDVELNKNMSIISGCVRSTEVQWFPAISNIVSPETRRYVAAVKLLQKVQNSPNLPVLGDINKAPIKRLKSRRLLSKLS